MWGECCPQGKEKGVNPPKLRDRGGEWPCLGMIPTRPPLFGVDRRACSTASGLPLVALCHVKTTLEKVALAVG